MMNQGTTASVVRLRTPGVNSARTGAGLAPLSLWFCHSGLSGTWRRNHTITRAGMAPAPSIRRHARS